MSFRKYKRCIECKHLSSPPLSDKYWFIKDEVCPKCGRLGAYEGVIGSWKGIPLFRKFIIKEVYDFKRGRK